MRLTLVEPVLHASFSTRHFTCGIYSILNAGHASSILYLFSNSRCRILLLCSRSCAMWRPCSYSSYGVSPHDTDEESGVLRI